jgi:hypothetical protein
MALLSTVGRTEDEARNPRIKWGLALLGAALAVGLWGTHVFPGRVRYVLFIGLVLGALILMIRRPVRTAKRANEPAVDESEMIALTVVPNQVQANVVCGMLQADGVVCRFRQTDFGAGSMDGMPGGPQQILVHESDVDRARELLARAR